jgi:valacyclovir hydrolase
VGRLLDVIGSQDSAVLGFSDGGETALILAARRPDLARGLVIWGTFGCIPPSVMDWINSLIPVDSWRPELAPWRDAIIEHHGQGQWPGLVTSFVQTARVLAEAGWDAPLQHAKSILCPVLQLHGELEERANPTEVAQLASAIPNCWMQVIADADHSLQLEKPEEFTSLVRSFLVSLDGSTRVG